MSDSVAGRPTPQGSTSGGEFLNSMEVISRLRQVLRSLAPGDDRQYERQLPPGDPRRTDSLVPGTEDGSDLVGSLLSGGVLVEQGEGLVLSTGFEESWNEEMAELRILDDEPLASAVATATPDVERAVAVDDQGRAFVVVDRGDDQQLWVSRAVAIAEVGALRSLPETVPPEHRVSAARPLRLFLESCPDCEGRVDTVAADDWPAADHPDEGAEELLVCYDCGERLYGF